MKQHAIRTVYAVHHSHTDIGYTDLQEHVIDLQTDYIRSALRLMREPENADFRWNCETLYCVEQFFESAAPEEQRLFLELAAQGRIGLSANYLNFTDLLDCGIYSRRLSTWRERFADSGITLRTAMCADINGLSMGQRDAMIDNGIEFFTLIFTVITEYIRCGRTRTPISGRTRTAAVCWFGTASIITWEMSWACVPTIPSIS